MKMIIFFFTFTALNSFADGHLPTWEELESIGAEDEFVSSKEQLIETKELLRNGTDIICSIATPGTGKEIVLQQNDCREVIESIREEFCFKWPKSSYTIIQKRCQLEDWKVVRETCTNLKTLGVGFCQ